jgi:hypothetical protein
MNRFVPDQSGFRQMFGDIDGAGAERAFEAIQNLAIEASMMQAGGLFQLMVQIVRYVFESKVSHLCPLQGATKSVPLWFCRI